MKQDSALEVINKLKEFAVKCNSGLIIVGSVAYRSAMIHPELFRFCDDIDCVFVYKTISDLKVSEFVDEALIEVADGTLSEKCDLFATKKVINGIKLSIDFVSLSYLDALSKTTFDGENKYRYKLTDSEEVSLHTYCDWFGNTFDFIKEFFTYQKYRIYKLPTHLYLNGAFFAGVLLTKLLFNPIVLCSVENQDEYVKLIQKNVCVNCPENGNVVNLYWKNKNFSNETIKFISEGMK